MAQPGSPLDSLEKFFKPLFTSPQQKEIERTNRLRRIQYLKRKYSQSQQRKEDE